jgi:protein-S-isoprenylcysteine O-methyltransferase Ste14
MRRVLDRGTVWSRVVATTMRLRTLVGSGDRIGLFALPVIVVGLALNIAFPALFGVGGPSEALRAVSIAVLVCGVTIWVWSVVLILRSVPRGELITTGPYRLVRHPLYTGVSLLVLPWLGFLLNSWLGLAVGLALYAGSRRYAPREEAQLSETFGAEWDAYERSVKLPWL